MIFSTENKVRYSEVDEQGIITIEALINYLQDCTMLHSESLGGGLKKLSESGKGWFLSAWQIDIEKLPHLYENITVYTSPYEFKGFFGSRNFWIENEQKERMLAANSIWVFMDLINNMPQKIMPEDSEMYEPMLPKIDMEYSSRKIQMPKEYRGLQHVAVHYSQIDTNHHVNNCQYITTAMEAAGLRTIPKRIRAEYKKAAVLGDIFYPFINESDGNYLVDLRNEDGVSFATITFEYNLEK